MASAAKVLSSFSAAQRVPEVRAVLAPAPSAPPRERSGWLELLRNGIGGWLLLAAVVVLWTVTWAAVAGPLSPVGEPGQRSEVAAVESAR